MPQGQACCLGQLAIKSHTPLWSWRLCRPETRPSALCFSASDVLTRSYLHCFSLRSSPSDLSWQSGHVRIVKSWGYSGYECHTSWFDSGRFLLESVLCVVVSHVCGYPNTLHRLLPPLLNSAISVWSTTPLQCWVSNPGLTPSKLVPFPKLHGEACEPESGVQNSSALIDEELVCSLTSALVWLEELWGI